MFLALNELTHKVRSSLSLCGPEGGEMRAAVCPLHLPHKGPSERCQGCSGSVKTRGLIFARSFVIMQGEIVHE